ncbi:MAG TPA: hypothetical protein VFQ32_10185, partial [Ktedonobacterales bacterium]|nr:hypothetical protein [Ktedonobacterales bacterium]
RLPSSDHVRSARRENDLHARSTGACRAPLSLFSPIFDDSFAIFRETIDIPVTYTSKPLHSRISRPVHRLMKHGRSQNRDLVSAELNHSPLSDAQNEIPLFFGIYPAIASNQWLSWICGAFVNFLSFITTS